jgi:hypothetical protein
MRQIDNPVLRGMEMGSQESMVELQQLHEAIRQSAKNVNNVYMQNLKRKEELQNINAGLNATGTEENKNWDKFTSQQLDFLNNTLKYQNALMQMSTPHFVPNVETKANPKNRNKLMFKKTNPPASVE